MPLCGNPHPMRGNGMATAIRARWTRRWHRGGGRAWAQPSIYEAVPNSRRISGMARLHLSTFKLARVIPIAGWAARFYGKSSHGLWMLDKSALFTRKSLKINELWITRCALKPISPSLKKCGIPSALIRCAFISPPAFFQTLPAIPWLDADLLHVVRQ